MPVWQSGRHTREFEQHAPLVRGAREGVLIDVVRQRDVEVKPGGFGLASVPKTHCSLDLEEDYTSWLRRGRALVVIRSCQRVRMP